MEEKMAKQKAEQERLERERREAEKREKQEKLEQERKIQEEIAKQAKLQKKIKAEEERKEQEQEKREREQQEEKKKREQEKKERLPLTHSQVRKTQMLATSRDYLHFAAIKKKFRYFLLLVIRKSWTGSIDGIHGWMENWVDFKRRRKKNRFHWLNPVRWDNSQ